MLTQWTVLWTLALAQAPPASAERSDAHYAEHFEAPLAPDAERCKSHPRKRKGLALFVQNHQFGAVPMEGTITRVATLYEDGQPIAINTSAYAAEGTTTFRIEGALLTDGTTSTVVVTQLVDGAPAKKTTVEWVCEANPQPPPP